MIQSHLITSHVLDAIKSRLDDYHLDGFLQSNFLNKITVSNKRLIRALNEADIHSCADLKPEAQVVIYVPEGANIIPLRASSMHKGQIYLGVVESYSESDPFAFSVLMNENFFMQARQIRSETIKAYQKFPTSTDGGFIEYNLKSFYAYQKGKSNGAGDVAYVDYKRSIIQLSSQTQSGMFFTFPAYLIPEKIDYTKLVGNDGQVDLDKYLICTPEYAEQLLVLSTLKELIPETNKLFNVLSQRVAEETMRTINRMPVNQGAAEIKGYIGGGNEFSW